MTERILIQGGRVIDPASGIDMNCDLYLAEGRIAALGDQPEGFTPDLKINAKGLIVCPGFIDLSAHLREPGQEHKATIASESMAAAAAGITTLCCPPETASPIDTPAVVRLIREKAARAGKIRVMPVGALTRNLNGRDLSEMAALKAAGCLAMSNGHAAVANAQTLKRALEYAANFDLLVIIHPEDTSLADQGCVHEGEVSTRMGLPGIPYAAETVAVATVLALIEPTGARVHFAGISSGRAAEAIGRARKKGIPFTADVAAHQLHLTEHDIEGFNALCHVRPPLRSLEDRDALREAVRNGIISSICSDHQPHEPDAKLDAFPDTDPGMATLQTLLPLTLRLVEESHFDLATALATLTANPAEVLGLDTGRLSPGSPADVVVFDQTAEWVIDRESWQSMGLNTPFWGQTMRGEVFYTISSGRLVYNKQG